MTSATLIVTTYNGEDFIEEALANALAQTMANVEVVVVDDGSTDRTVSIIQAVEAVNPRLKLLKNQANFGGPARGKNHAIRHSTGELISFRDQDDLDHPQKLTEAAKIFEAYPETDVVFFDVIGFEDSAHLSRVSTHQYTRFLERASAYLHPLDETLYQCSNRYFGYMVKHLTGLGLSTQGVVIRRDSIEKYALYFSEEFKILDDTEMWFRVSRKCNIKYCHKPMAYFRQGASSLSSRAGSMMDEAERIHSQNYYAFASNLNSEELREFRRGLADLYFRMGYYHRAYRALSRQYLWQSLGYTKTAVAMLALAKSFIPFYGRDA